ncbi:MAG: class I SAM-dependent methyltransferase [Flavobacteriales bacterium]|nr:class I SAM-dependent methyltransferase [Flavobacteriales bacterium]
MAFQFHKDKETYIKMQYDNAKNYVIPFIEKTIPIKEGMRVMEIGCAEGGVLKAFTDLGCFGLGVELQDSRVQIAKQVFEEEIKKGQVELLSKDIYEMDLDTEIKEKFDLIILKDVIEHIHDQDRILAYMREFLKPNGHIFFGFPPWQMPFGGHQQIAKSKLLSKFPYYHMLPLSIYKKVLKAAGEDQKCIDDLIEIKETGISIERFQKLVFKNNYSIPMKEFYLFNPIYKYKFNLKPRIQNSFIGSIPILRNFLTTCVYYLIKK